MVFKITLTLLATLAGFIAAARAQDAKPANDGGQKQEKRSIPFEEGEPPAEFVPAHPRTAQDRDRLDALRLYTTARALEDRQRPADAAALLEKALQKDPASVPILRRLSLLYFRLGRLDQGVVMSRRVLEADPTDHDSLELLKVYYLRQRNDAAAVETLLLKTLESPKLDANAPARLVLLRELGDLYADALPKPEKAADTYDRLLSLLDEATVAKLSPADEAMILHDGEAESYRQFGEALLKVKRYEPAIQAFRRGLNTESEHAQLPRLLAEALVGAGKNDEALAVLDPFLKRQPPDLEPYELLGKVLTSLGRKDEILPRLEAAAKADPKNVSLQFALAERLRGEGQAEKADALLKSILGERGDPRAMVALAISLNRENKYEELIKLFGDALIKPGGVDAIRGQIEAFVEDPARVEKLLSTGIKMQSDSPPRLSEPSRKILVYMAARAKKTDLLIELDRAALKQSASLQNYRELFEDLYRNGKYIEAADTMQELLKAFPDERNPLMLGMLCEALILAGKNEQALEFAREAEKLEPNNQTTLLIIGSILTRMNKNDEAILHYKDLLKRFPNDENIFKRAHGGLSLVYTNIDDMPKAEAELEIVFERYPDDPGVNNDLGYLYADQGKNLEKAEAMIRKAIDDAPEEAAYLDSLGWVLFRQGQVEKSIEWLERAARGTNADATILDHLGDAHFRLRQYDKARAAWKKAEEYAARTNPPDKRLGDIRKKLEELNKLGPAPGAESSEKP